MSFIGIGRAGKTATIRSIQEEPFEETESTIGLEKMNFKVVVRKGGEQSKWEKSELPEKELETALVRNMNKEAQPMINTKLGGETSEATSQIKAQSSTLTNIGSNNNTKTSTQQLVSQTSSTAGSSAVDVDINPAQLPSSVQVDEEFVARAMKDKAQVSSSLVLSIVDMGGNLSVAIHSNLI
jgi:hypothetical protein